MLRNISKNLFLLRDKEILLKRCNLTQIPLNIRSKQTTVSSKNKYAISNIDNDENDQPIKFSSSKAATMRVDEYRNPYGDTIPWYQDYIVLFSFSIFLIYFCILREENDIDVILNNSLEDTLKQSKIAAEKKAQLASK